ncbi:host attachment protein [Desulfonatronovibrio hydrogenovorans]|uniref:host attachment protein n=1 Tax=Desulfonatronovibrio hydrogenovorans TaxID=53245 RepID=UPI0005560B9B|nr:host attachment protein [Desulfonatronovibrio hydrogenovorans]
MEKIWVLAADNSRARLFETTKRTALEKEIQSMVHPAGRKSVHDLVEDRPGRNPHVADSEKRVAYAPSVDPKKHEAHQFARSLAGILNKAARNNEFQKLYILAPPSMLGMLRAELDHHSKEKLLAQVDKNVTQLKMEEIRKQLPEYM